MSKLIVTSLVFSLATGCGSQQQPTASQVSSTGAANLAAVSNSWLLRGSDPADYAMQGDPTANQLILSSTSAPSGQFGTAMTTVAASSYLGKRVRLSASVAAEDVTSWAGLWLRVDGAAGALLAFDNMANRPIAGTLAATSYSVVLDVDPSAQDLAYGVLLAGPGAVTVSSLTLEVVDASVPPTGLSGGWLLAGSAPGNYAAAGNPTHAAPDGLVLSSTTASSDVFGTVMTQVNAAAYLGNRVRLTAIVRAENVSTWAGLWLRVDGPSQQVLAFDNMSDRPITGTVGATTYTVELDVAAQAVDIAYGALLEGSGAISVSSLVLETVD